MAKGEKKQITVEKAKYERRGEKNSASDTQMAKNDGMGKEGRRGSENEAGGQ